MISFQSTSRYLLWPTLFAIVAALSACERSKPSVSQIQEYIENYQIAHDYSVASMNYEIEPGQGDELGSIQVSGKLVLREPLYVEDLGNSSFRKSVAKMLRRNRFSEREINHEIYDRVIRASARVQNSENDYYTFLKEEHAPGFTINFSADLIYKKGIDGFMLDGAVRHQKLLGARIIKFTNPVTDDTKLVEGAVKRVLAEQLRYREMMKDSSALLSRFWDNDFGVVVWNRKVPYLGNENLSPSESMQLAEFSDWRGVFRISNIKPVQYRTPHASNFFELGTYTTEGVATCLRQTGFIDELTFAKSSFDQYCEFGKQYPVQVEMASMLNETNDYIASIEFEINGVSSGELVYDSSHFHRERNELARYSDRQRVVILDKPFVIKAHNRPVFNLVKSAENETGQLRLEYTDVTDYELARFDSVNVPDQQVVVTAKLEKPIVETGLTEVGEKMPDETVQSNSAEADNDKSDASITNSPLTKKELVKAIQLELKRFNVYNAKVDGIAGEYTFWSMSYVQKQLGKGNFTKPSEEFLAVLRATPDDAIKPPATPYRPIVKQQAPKPKAKSGTLAGKALKGTGRAIGNGARWVGGLFSSKERKKKSKKEN